MRADNKNTKEDRKSLIENMIKDQIQHKFDKAMRGWQESTNDVIFTTTAASTEKIIKISLQHRKEYFTIFSKQFQKLSKKSQISATLQPLSLPIQLTPSVNVHAILTVSTTSQKSVAATFMQYLVNATNTASKGDHGAGKKIKIDEASLPSTPNIKVHVPLLE